MQSTQVVFYPYLRVQGPGKYNLSIQSFTKHSWGDIHSKKPLATQGLLPCHRNSSNRVPECLQVERIQAHIWKLRFVQLRLLLILFISNLLIAQMICRTDWALVANLGQYPENLADSSFITSFQTIDYGAMEKVHSIWYQTQLCFSCRIKAHTIYHVLVWDYPTEKQPTSLFKWSQIWEHRVGILRPEVGPLILTYFFWIYFFCHCFDMNVALVYFIYAAFCYINHSGILC